MKIYAISDLHLSISTDKSMEVFGGAWENYLTEIKKDWKEKVSEEDLVLIAGDISWAMKLQEFEKDLTFFEDLPGKKVIIRGNHDYWWKSISGVRNALKPNMYALQNDAIKFDNVIICGTRGWTVCDKSSSDEDKKIYKRELIRLELALKSATSLKQEGDKIIVMLHYPPYLPNSDRNEMIDLIDKYDVASVVFGHVHYSIFGYNFVKIINNKKYYLTSCDLVNNKLVEIN